MSDMSPRQRNRANKTLRLLTPELAEEKHRQYLEKDESIRAVTLCFSDIEGRMHMLDFDKDQSRRAKT